MRFAPLALAILCAAVLFTGLSQIGFVDEREARDAEVARACAALGLVLLTASIGARHFGMRAGWCAAAVLATMLGLPLAARMDGAQVLASLLGWVGCAGFADAVFGRPAGRDLRLVTAY